MFTTTTPVAALFATVFATATETEFNPAWANGTGYFDGVCSIENNAIFAEGQIYKCIDNINRRLLIVGTAFGAAVVFDRFQKGDKEVFVTNYPQTLRETGLINSSGRLSRPELVEFIGDTDLFEDLNVGQKIVRLRKAFARLEQRAAAKVANVVLDVEPKVGDVLSTQIGNGGDYVWSENASVLLVMKDDSVVRDDAFIGVVSFAEGVQVLNCVIKNHDDRREFGDMYVNGGTIWLNRLNEVLDDGSAKRIRDAVLEHQAAIDKLPLSVRMTK